MHSRSAWLDALAQHASDRPAAIAIAEVAPDGQIEKTVTWRDFASAAGIRTHALGNSVPCGASVLVARPSGIDLAAWFAGAIAAGVRLVLMHPRSGAGECAAVCERAKVQAILAAGSLLTRVPESVIQLKDFPLAGCTPSSPAQDCFLTATARLPGSIVLGSSGTTGLPKLVVRAIAALDADARAVARGLSLTADDCVLCVPPICHSYGVDILLGTLFAGATLRVMNEFDPVGAARQLVSGVTVLPGLPFVFETLARFGNGRREATNEAQGESKLRLVVSAGSPLSSRVRKEFTSSWNLEIGQLYGATELGTVSVSIPGESGFDAASVGSPLPEVSFRVVDVDDPTRVLPTGEEGQFAVRAPSMLSEYIGADLALIDGHMLTGDLARLDREGRATITGRLKLLIDTGGFKVNPLEVEAALLEHPDVVECMVAPLALSDTIQRSLALIVVRDATRPPGDAELRRFLREQLAPIKIPRSFEVVKSLPRSPLGKLMRDQLFRRII